jgi:AmiR/NasT family two-component response regulator
MKQKVLIVEDQFIEANDLELMLLKAGYEVTGIAHSVADALELLEEQRADLVLVDIFLKGNQTGIDLAQVLHEKDIPFIFISANSNHEVLVAAKATQPYGFIVKPFRERDLMVTLEIAQYRYENSAEATMRKEEVLRGKLKNIAAGNEGW